MEALELETQIEDDDKINLMSGDDFLIFPPDRNGMVSIWVNCNKEMNIHISFYDLKVSVNNLFGEKIRSADFIFYLQRGSILYTDKKSFKTVSPSAMPMQSPIPSLKDLTKQSLTGHVQHWY